MVKWLTVELLPFRSLAQKLSNMAQKIATCRLVEPRQHLTVPFVRFGVGTPRTNISPIL